MIFTITLLLLTTILTILHLFMSYKNRRVRKLLEKHPQITSFPFIGTTYRYINKNLFVGSQEIIADIGLPSVTWVGTTGVYTTDQPNEAKTILNTALNKSNNYKYLNIIFEKTLLLAPAEEWKKNRKIFAKGFNQLILDEYVPIFHKKSQVLLKILGDGKFVDLFDVFQTFAMDCFLETTIGVDYNIQEKQDTQCVHYISRVQNIVIKRMFRPVMYFDWVFNMFGEGKELKDVMVKTDKFLDKIIKDSMERRRNNKALMDLLLESFSKEHITRELSLFWSAAFDTTGTALAFTCVLLGMHQMEQDKLYQEIVENIRDIKEINHQDLSRFKYLDMVIQESLRILPVVPFVGRTTTEDIDLGDHVIPKGTELIVAIYNLHHNKDIYKEPERFNPERFTIEEILKRPPCSFIPFSSGPRNCIGWKYAMMQMKTVLINIIYNFKITSKHKTIQEFGLESDVVLKATKPIDCTFIKRKINKG